MVSGFAAPLTMVARLHEEPPVPKLVQQRPGFGAVFLVSAPSSARIQAPSTLTSLRSVAPVVAHGGFTRARNRIEADRRRDIARGAV